LGQKEVVVITRSGRINEVVALINEVVALINEVVALINEVVL
jgi:hypothetical protein